MRKIRLFLFSVFCLLFLPVQAKDNDNLLKGQIAYEGGSQAEAIQKFKDGSLEGSGACELMLGVMYSYGSGLKKDPVKGKKWLQKASEHGAFQFPEEVEKCDCQGGNFILLNEENTGGQWNGSLFLKEKNSDKKTKVFDYVRSGDAFWSPDCSRLMIVDAMGSDMTETYVYKVSPTGSISKIYDLHDEFVKEVKTDIGFLKDSHLYFEGYGWLDETDVIFRANGLGEDKGEVTFSGLFEFDFKNGIKKLK